jgi:catechol 2,3-dioxygenase-like lactoylglutathione lyase family enzyme
MLGRAPIIAFVATARPEVARKFYTDVLGLELTSDDQFAMAFDAGGTMLRVARVEHLEPPGYTVLGWIVDDIQAAVAALAARGVAFERYGFGAQDANGVWTAPSGAQVAWFNDPDGNTLSLTQLPTTDPAAT